MNKESTTGSVKAGTVVSPLFIYLFLPHSRPNIWKRKATTYPLLLTELPECLSQIVLHIQA